MDKDQFWKLIDPLQESLFKFAYSILHNSEDSRDAVQDVLEKLWIKREFLNSGLRIDSYALKIMKNHCIDFLRKKKTKNEISNLDFEFNCEQEYENIDLVYKIKKRMLQLPLNQRMIIELRDFQGLKFDEISEILEVPIPNLRVLLSRARRKIIDEFRNER